MTKVGIDATNAVLFVVLQSAILQLPPFNYMALSIRSSNPSAVSSHIVYKNILIIIEKRGGIWTRNTGQKNARDPDGVDGREIVSSHH